MELWGFQENSASTLMGKADRGVGGSNTTIPGSSVGVVVGEAGF